MTFRRIRSVLAFPDREWPRRTLLAAVVLFVTSAAFFAIVPRFEPPFASPVHRLLHAANHVLWWEYYVVGLVVGIALLTVRRRSLQRAWLLAFAGGAGVGVNLGGIALTGGSPGLVFILLWAGVLGIVTALLFDTVGFLLGARL